MGSARRRPLRVLIVGQAPGTPGGIGTVQRTQVTSLRRHDDVPVTVAVTYADVGALGRVVRLVRGLLEALTPVLLRRVDVVDLHMSKGLSVLRKGLVVLVARARGVPTVIHAHAGAFAAWFDGLPRPARGLVAALLRPDRLVVLSDEARDVYAARLRVPPEHIVVAANPVDIPTTPPERDIHGPVEAVFLGRLVDRKGVFDLVEALALMDPGCRERLHVTMAGHGEVEAVRQRITELGLSDAVEVRTWLGPDERDALLHRAQLLVLPSWWEALPMAVLEAMAWAVTPVVTPVGALATLVRDGRNGAVVPLKDPPALAAALEKLVVDDERRARLGAAARADVADYGAEAWTEDLLALYDGMRGR